jgi:hypothetical protein
LELASKITAARSATAFDTHKRCQLRNEIEGDAILTGKIACDQFDRVFEKSFLLLLTTAMILLVFQWNRIEKSL